MKHRVIKTKEEHIKALVAIGVTGIDKPWKKMSMDEKSQYAIFVDKKRAKEVNVAKISDEVDRAIFLAEFPRLVKRYDINKFSDVPLSLIVSKTPSLLKKVNKNRFPKLEWGTILADQPQLARHCDFTWILAHQWPHLMNIQPQFIDRFDPSRFTSADDWHSLLLCPSLWRKCPFESFVRTDQIRCAALSLPLLKKLGPATLNEKEWLELLRWADFFGSKVGKWLARELKRLSGSLKL